MSVLKGLLNSVSGGALFSSLEAEAEVKARAEGRVFGLRPTPRHPERHPGFKVASPRRAKQRRDAKARYDLMLLREREIGVDPRYRNRRSETKTAEVLDWALKARKWHQAHAVAANG